MKDLIIFGDFMMTKPEFISLIDELIRQEMLLGGARSENKLQGYRNIKSDFTYISSNKTELSPLDILKQMYKERVDNVKIYEASDRKDLWLQELTERNIIQAWLPKEPDEKEVVDFLNTLTDIPKSKSSFKKFQDACFEKFGQKVDSQIISKFIG